MARSLGGVMIWPIIPDHYVGRKKMFIIINERPGVSIAHGQEFVPDHGITSTLTNT